MKRFTILGAFAVLALVVVGTVSAASGPKATGDVTWNGGGGSLVQAIFSAQPGADGFGSGAKGQVWLATRTITWTGTVTCYFQGTGPIADGGNGSPVNFARFSGVVTSHTDGVTSNYFEIQVVDNVNGVGSTNTTWDTIGTTRTTKTGNLTSDVTTSSTCGTNTFSHDITIAGNLQVHQ